MASASTADKDKKRKKKDKVKDKPSGSANAGPSELDENRGPEWPYRPPEGAVLLTDCLDSEEFDYDSLKGNEDLELWIVRVPDGLKPKHLDGLQMSVPATSGSSRIGSLSKKHVSYDIWSIQDSATANDSRFGVETSGGDEVLGLTCMLPRRKKGAKLALAPVPVAHHVVLTVQPTLPTPPPSSPEQQAGSVELTMKNPERYRHPKHLLKHRFLPSGTVQEIRSEKNSMDVDSVTAAVPPKPSSKAKSSSPSKPAKKDGVNGKKRKGDDEGSKKAKKVKTAS